MLCYLANALVQLQGKECSYKEMVIIWAINYVFSWQQENWEVTEENKRFLFIQSCRSNRNIKKRLLPLLVVVVVVGIKRDVKCFSLLKIQ